MVWVNDRSWTGLCLPGGNFCGGRTSHPLDHKCFFIFLFSDFRKDISQELEEGRKRAKDQWFASEMPPFRHCPWDYPRRLGGGVGCCFWGKTHSTLNWRRLCPQGLLTCYWESLRSGAGRPPPCPVTFHLLSGTSSSFLGVGPLCLHSSPHCPSTPGATPCWRRLSGSLDPRSRGCQSDLRAAGLQAAEEGEGQCPGLWVGCAGPGLS